METKRLRHVLHEYIALFSGSDYTANTFLRSTFGETTSAHILCSPELVEGTVSLVVKRFPLVQEELNEEWRRGLLQNLIILASSNKDIKGPLRKCRSKIDYVTFAGLDEVKNDNGRQFKELSSAISSAVACLDGGVPSDATKLYERILYKHRLGKWLERAVLVDMALSVTHSLSDKGQKHLERFRDCRNSEHVPDDIAYMVYTSLDRRLAWKEIEEEGLDAKEIRFAVLDACDVVRQIREGAYEGKVRDYICHGVSRGASVANLEEKIHIEPEFAEMEPYLSEIAQSFYDLGSSTYEARELIEQFQKVALDLGQSDDESIADEASADDNESENEARDTEKGSIASHSGVVVESQDDDERERTCSEILEEIIEDFGPESVHFFDINLGLTGVIEAKEEHVSGVFNKAFAGKLVIDALASGEKNSWAESLQDTNVLLIALSYKHLSKSVRMGSSTIAKVSKALCEIAKTRGCAKINIWIDAILSSNRNLRDSSWAVSGLLPYLTCDVIRITGKDDEYSDRGGSSMWMRVEERCADEVKCVEVRLDTSRCGYSWKTAVTGSHMDTSRFSARKDGEKFTRVSIKARMMHLAQSICRGDLMDSAVSWPQDKHKLILWAECCMLQQRSIIMNDETLRKLTTLRIDNMRHEDVAKLVAVGARGNFASTGRKLVSRGWLGIFEIFPGLSEASLRERNLLSNFVREEKRVMARGMQFGPIAVFEISNIVIWVNFTVQGEVVEVSLFNDVSIENAKMEFEAEGANVVKLTGAMEAEWFK